MGEDVEEDPRDESRERRRRPLFPAPPRDPPRSTNGGGAAPPPPPPPPPLAPPLVCVDEWTEWAEWDWEPSATATRQVAHPSRSAREAAASSNVFPISCTSTTQRPLWCWRLLIPEFLIRTTRRDALVDPTISAVAKHLRLTWSRTNHRRDQVRRASSNNSNAPCFMGPLTPAGAEEGGGGVLGGGGRESLMRRAGTGRRRASRSCAARRRASFMGGRANTP